MDWTSTIDLYCERIGPAFWGEPLNTASNAGFLLAAALAWRLARKQADWGPKILAALIGVIGLASFALHTTATSWASAADTGSITAFILAYLYLGVTRLFNLPEWAGLAAVGGFFPYTVVSGKVFRAAFGSLNGSVGYLPPVLLMLVLAGLALKAAPRAGLALLAAAGLMAVALALRTADAAVCPAFPAGVHFLWHLLAALLLWWLVRLLVRHQAASLASGPARG